MTNLSSICARGLVPKSNLTQRTHKAYLKTKQHPNLSKAIKSRPKNTEGFLFPDLNSVSQERCSLSVESSVALTPQGHMGELSKTAAQSQVLGNEHSKEQVNSSKADSASRSGSAKGKAVQYSAKVKFSAKRGGSGRAEKECSGKGYYKYSRFTKECRILGSSVRMARSGRH